MKMDDYYKILGVAKSATKEEIQKAYRQLARKYHPDLNQEDQKNAKEQFQKVQEAFDVLGDAEKRQMYDQYGISPDQMGTGGGQGPFQWSFAGGRPGRGTSGRSSTRRGPAGHTDFRFDNIDGIDLMQMFGNAFGNASPGDIFGNSNMPRRGRDVEQILSIPFVLSITGGKIDVKIGQQTVAVSIPPGIVEGKKIRLPGLGEASPNGGEPGNLMLNIQVDEHPCFSRRGNSLYLDLPISLKEAVFGAKIDVATPKGNVTLTVPAGASSGMKLRIKQCGIGNGDLFVILLVALPKNWSEADKKLLQQLTTEPHEPIRRNIVW